MAVRLIHLDRSPQGGLFSSFGLCYVCLVIEKFDIVQHFGQGFGRKSTQCFNNSLDSVAAQKRSHVIEESLSFERVFGDFGEVVD